MFIGQPRPIQVHLVAQPMVCWGLERLVQSAHPRLEVTGMASTAAESLPMLEQSAPDVVVLDLDGDEPAEALTELQARTHAKILVLTGSSNVAMLDRAVLAGVRGVVK